MESREKDLTACPGLQMCHQRRCFSMHKNCCYSSSRAPGNHLEEVGIVLVGTAVLDGHSKALGLLGYGRWGRKSLGKEVAFTRWPGWV